MVYCLYSRRSISPLEFRAKDRLLDFRVFIYFNDVPGGNLKSP